MNAILQEEYTRSIARAQLLTDARERLRRGDLDGALYNVLHVVDMLSDAENRILRVHAECVSILEQGRKILELDASLRPVIVKLDGPTELPTEGAS